MDPDATLKQIDDFLLLRKTGAIVDVWVEELATWLNKGGFDPDWDRYPLATSYFNTITGRKV